MPSTYVVRSFAPATFLVAKGEKLLTVEVAGTPQFVFEDRPQLRQAMQEWRRITADLNAEIDEASAASASVEVRR
jgi:hypothetical protein